MEKTPREWKEGRDLSQRIQTIPRTAFEEPVDSVKDTRARAFDPQAAH